MPIKEYKYRVVIENTVSNRDLKRGVGELEKELTKTERRALKAVEAFEKLSKAIAVAEKANQAQSRSNSRSGFDTQAIKAAADISRMRQQNERAEREITRAVEREAKQQAQIRTREMRKSANDMIREINRVQAEESKAAKPRGSLGSAGSSAIGSFVGNLGAQAVSTVTAALVEGGKAVLDYSAKLEQTKIGFTSLLGSGEKANQLLKEIQEFAKSTPFEFEGIAALSQRLAGANVEAKKIIPLMRDIGNVVAATGEASQERLEGVTVAITQVISKQKFSAEEAEQLAERGVNAFQILSEATGKSQADLRKMSEDGKISSDVFIKALQQISQQKFGDAMEKQSRTFSGAMSNIKDSIMIAASQYFEPLYQKISEISVRSAKELEGADFNQAIAILAKNFAKGLGEALSFELKREWDEFDWNKVFTPTALGSNLAEGMFGNWNVYDWLTGNLKPEKAKNFANKFTADLDKAIDFNGVKYKFDPLTNTLQQVKEQIKSTPSLAKQLDANKAAEDAKKLSKELNSIALDYSRQIVFFGQDTEVAAAKQQLLAKGVTDFSTGAAKAVIGMAGMLDNLKASKKTQDEYNENLKSARQELTQLKNDTDFKLKFANPSELDEFNYKVSQSTDEFQGLKVEIDAVRDSLKLLAQAREFNKAGNKTETFLDSLRGSLQSLNQTKTTPFQNEISGLLKNVELFTAAGEKLDSTGIVKNLEDRILNQRDGLGLLNDWAANAVGDPETVSKALQEKTVKLVDDWYADFTNYIRTIRQKVETDAEDGTKRIDYVAFFEGKEGNEATIIKFIELFNALQTAQENAANVSFNETIEGLDQEIASLNQRMQTGVELSRADALAKQLQSDAYKNFTPEMKQAAMAKAQEIDGLHAAIKAQEDYREAFEQTAGVFEDALTDIFEGGWKGFFDGVLDNLKHFLIRAAAEMLASKFFKLLNPNSGSASTVSGGGFLDSIKSLFGLGGRGAGATPNFNPNVIPPTGTINAAGQFVVNGNQPDLRSVLGDLAPGLLPGTSGGGKSSTSGLFGKSGIFGEKGFGNNTGTYGVIGTGAALLGSLVGGRFGGLLTGAGSGLALGAQIGSIIPGIGTAIGAGVGAVVGGLIGLITGGTRKKDERTRNQATLDAFSAIDKLMQQVNNDVDFTDAAGVISQGATIRQSYLDSANSLKDKKTRNIALKDVSRIDEKLRQLETLAKAKASKTKSRAESLTADIPTFSDGGAISDFAMKNFPNGFISGPGTGRSDSILARISNGEYILDAATVKNIGVANLDALRAAQGKMKYVKTPFAYADGGAIGSPVGSVGASGAGGGPMKVEVSNNFVFSADGESVKARSDVYGTDADGKRYLIETVEQEIYRNGKDSKIYQAVENVKKGNR